MTIQEKNFSYGGNMLTIHFDEDQGVMVLNNVLTLMLSCQLKYSYLIFGYNEGNFDISPYYMDYPELESEDKGIIKLKNKDRDNIQFIYEILNNYQMKSLYINNYEDMVERFDFTRWRNAYNRADGGYAILDMSFDYLLIDKESNLPDWDFDRLDINI